jgi:hypothetical protein
MYLCEEFLQSVTQFNLDMIEFIVRGKLIVITKKGKQFN